MPPGGPGLTQVAVAGRVNAGQDHIGPLTSAFLSGSTSLSHWEEFAGSGIISPSQSSASSHVVILVLFYVIAIDFFPDDLL